MEWIVDHCNFSSFLSKLSLNIIKHVWHIDGVGANQFKCMFDVWFN